MNKKGLLVMIFGIILLVILIFVAIAYQLLYSLIIGEETITIKEKWRKSSGGDKYLVSSKDEQVFQITDTIIKMRFDSSNLYAQLNEGDTCKIKTQRRFPFFSDYKNILEADCLK